MKITEEPKLTRENLLAHGFRQSEKSRDSFVAEHARLGDVESAPAFEDHRASAERAGARICTRTTAPPRPCRREAGLGSNPKVRDEKGRIVHRFS